MWKWWFTALRLVIKLLGRRNANGSLNVAVKWFWFNVFWQVLEALSSAAPRINSLSLPSSYVSLFEHTHTSSHSLPHTHTHTHTQTFLTSFSPLSFSTLSHRFIASFSACVCFYLFALTRHFSFSSECVFFFFFFWNSSLHPSHLLIMRRENWGCAERNSPPPKKKQKTHTKHKQTRPHPSSPPFI